MKKIFFILITIVLVFIVFAILAEIGLRIFWNGKPAPSSPGLKNLFYPEPTEEIGFVLKPNHYFNLKKYKFRTNRLGFRIADNIAFEKNEDVFRVVVLGDSIVFGYGTIEAFTISSRIEQYLNRYNIPGKKNVQALNLAVPGYNMTQYLAVLKKYGLKYKPDVIVVGLAIINDFDGFFMTYLTNGLLNPVPVFDSTGYNYNHKSPSRFLWNSYLFRSMYYKFAVSWEQLIKGPKNPPGEDRRYRRRLPASCDSSDEIWDNIKKILDEFKTISDKNETKILFLLFPTAEQLFYRNSKTPVPRTTQDIIIKLLDDRELSYIDLFDYYNSYYLASKELPYCDLSSHPDNAGHRIAAHHTVDWIVGQEKALIRKSFSGILTMGDAESSPFLTDGWTNIREDSGGFRWVEGNTARITFDKFRNDVKELEFTIKNVEGCTSQQMSVVLNKEPLDTLTINPSGGFAKYKIILKNPVSLKTLNHLDLSFSCCYAKRDSSNKKHGNSKFLSVAVSEVRIR